MKIICFIKFIYRSIRYAFWFGPGDDTISGCDYVEQDDGSIKCKFCGHISK